MIRDRLSWMRFFGFDLGGAMPDEDNIRHYRNRLTESGTLEALMQAFEQQLREAGDLGMGGQIVDATLVPAPKERNTEGEKAAIKAGKSARQIWRGKPNQAPQKDVDVRWTVKIGGKIRYRPDGTPLPQIATPVFGYKSHISIDRRFGFIRKATVTSAAHSDGRQPHPSPQVQGQADARAHGAGQCRQVSNPRQGRACLRAPETPLWPLYPNHRLGQSQAKLILANLAYNFDRLILHERCAATG